MVRRAAATLDSHALAVCDAVISEEERASVRRFVHEANERERLVARALVRTALAGYRNVAPASLRFSVWSWGKPEIFPPCDLQFNLAHHPTLVVCAVSDGRAVGIDVEPLSRHPQISEVADRVFAPSELAELAALDDSRRADRLVSLWTLKEAYIKARGMGLSLPLRELALRFDDRSPRLVASEAVGPDPSRWAFVTIDVEEHRIAVALEVPTRPFGFTYVPGLRVINPRSRSRAPPGSPSTPFILLPETPARPRSILIARADQARAGDMQNRPGFSCFVIGQDTLLIECTEILLAHGHQIKGVISSSPRILAWATENGLSTVDPKSDYVEALRREPFDYLFAITHLAIIPEEAIVLAKRGAIIFTMGRCLATRA